MNKLHIPRNEILTALPNSFFSLLSLENYEDHISKDLNSFNDWIENDFQGNMTFLKENQNVRKNPEHILSEAKSALVFLFPYATGNRVRGKQNKKNIPQAAEGSLIHKKIISKYVYGKDYHKIIKKNLNEYAEKIKSVLNIDFNYRPIVDSVPFFERSAGAHSGLGFIGKNTMLIRPGTGSFFFIGTLLTSLAVEKLSTPDAKNHAIQNLDCGTCRKCLDACPTNAFDKEYVLNANKCLSYLTIEHREIVKEKYLPFFKETIYGCDICQNVCPYNFVTQDYNFLADFKSYHPPFLSLTAEKIALMNEKQYAEWFGGTAATRAKYQGLVRNALYHLYAIGYHGLENILNTLSPSSYGLINDTLAQIRTLYAGAPFEKE